MTTDNSGNFIFRGTPGVNDIGNVGIGTTSPAEKLTVIGNISASGNLYIEGSNVDFNNLPTSAVSASAGGLYKRTGAQLGLSFPTSGSTYFVLIK